MSKKWKIAIGVVVAAVVVAGVALAVWGAVTFRNRVHEYGWEPRARKWGPEATTQLEVRLVDDDGDGIPDRGVIEVPEDLQNSWGYGPHFGSGHRPRFGRGFGPSILRRGPSTSLRTSSGQAMLRTGPHFSWGFGPLFIVGGLFRLAFLVLLIGLAVACFHRWSRAKEAREPQRD
jgi:hypothetical protein